MTPQLFKTELLSGKKLCYYHRLAPLMSIFINLMSLNCFGIGKCTKYVMTVYKGLKNLKNL